MKKRWTDKMDETTAIQILQRYCAPTALSMLLSIPQKEAARILLRAAGRSRGSVDTTEWRAFLIGLGGKYLDTSKPEKEIDAKMAERWRRYHEKIREFEEGKRLTYPRPPRAYKHAMFTVAEFLRRNSRGWIVFGTHGHTLVACNGRVVRDTLRSRSMKGRVKYAIHFTEERVIQLRKAEEGR